MQPSDQFVFQFGSVAACAAVFELRVRMLSDNTPELRRHAFEDLTPLLKKLVAHFSKHLDEGESQFLLRSAVVRNKLFHLELSRVSGRLVDLGEQLRDSPVVMADVETGDVTNVEQTSTQEGRIFGWLLQAVTSGAFGKAVDVFERAAGGARARTYRAYVEWIRERAALIDLRKFGVDLPRFSPRLVQQALYAFSSKSNRVARGDGCRPRCPSRELCPLASHEHEAPQAPASASYPRGAAHHDVG